MMMRFSPIWLPQIFNAGFVAGPVCVTEADEACDSMTCVSHRAAYNGDVQQLETLLETAFLSLDHRDQLGSTMLHKGKDVDAEEMYGRRRVAVADPGIWNGGGRLPLPSLQPSSSFSLPLPSFFPSLPSFPLEVGPLNLVRVSGEGCKLP